jgi:glycerol-3-phosphate dehydrogenase
MHGGKESAVSRMHKVVDGEPLAGVISVLGGKITGYRAIAEEVTNAVCTRIGRKHRCTTADTPLPGARVESAEPDPTDQLSFLRVLYGSRAGHVRALARAAADLDRPLSPRYPDIAAQVIFGIRFEHCVRVSDFIRRRTLLGASADQGWDAAPRVAALMATELGWSSGQLSAELEAYRRDIDDTRAFTKDR